MYKKLLEIQQELKVPKSRRNSFGKYNYRSCEDIVEAVKPLCAKHDCVLTLSDQVVEVGGRVFVRATATLSGANAQSETEDLCDGVSYTIRSESIDATGYAEIAPEKKGMDVAQITGAASSYARKYALNGLFAIDDVQDADATNNHGKKKDHPEPPSEELDLE